VRQRAEVAEATLESERDAFEEGKECLEDDLDHAPLPRKQQR